MVVNLRQSMPRLLQHVRDGIPDDVILEQIERDTTTAWAGISLSARQAYADYVVGVHGAHIASVYKIDSCDLRAVPGRVRFDVSSAPRFAAMIGEPVPGGSWKRGEARPVRYVETAAVEEHFREQGMEFTSDGPTPEERIVEFVRSAAAPAPIVSGSGSILDQVEVAKDPRGGITVTVPLGTKVTVVQRAG
jgi:hypothetical protein